MIEMIVFDMAGTTVDEDNLVYKTLRQAINTAGYDFTLDEVLAEAAGKEKLDATKAVLALRDPDATGKAEKIYAEFLGMLSIAYQQAEVKEQPGASELFAFLKANDVFVVLNTGYNRETALMLINKIGWKQGEDFDLLITASDVVLGRPNPDMIFAAMRTLSMENSNQIIKVGDSIIDIEEGKNAFCRFSIGITTGAHTREQLKTANPDYIISSLAEIRAIISDNK